MQKLKRVDIFFGIIIACIICIFLVVMARGMTFAQYVAKGDSENIMEQLVSVSGYERGEKGFFHMVGEDPQLYFDLTDTALAEKNGKIDLHFGEKIDLSTVQAYFKDSKTDFSELNSQTFESVMSQNLTIYCSQPITHLRLDINQDFSLSEITCVETEMHREVSLWKYIICFLMAILIASGVVAYSLVFGDETNAAGAFMNRIRKLRDKFSMLLFDFIVLLAALPIGYFFERIHRLILRLQSFNIYTFFMYYCLLILIAETFHYRKQLYVHAHRFIFFVIMVLGTFHIVVAPPLTGISWDDETHFERAAYVSWGCCRYISQAEGGLASSIYSYHADKNIYTRDGRKDLESIVNKTNLYEKREWNSSLTKMAFVAYIPSAIGLSLGRGMGLSAVQTFLLGKWFNLFCYAIIISLSIKCLRKSGKLVVSAIGLIPTLVLMASAYSYDWWVVSMIILAYSLFIGNIQDDRNVTIKNMTGIACVFVLGILPKAVYIPLIIPMFLIRKEKFRSVWKCRIAGGIVAFIVALTFLIPVMTNKVGADLRGGADVNASAQIQYIISKPLEYMFVLFKFLVSYLNPDTTSEYFTQMVYYGLGSFFTVCLMVLVVAAFIDNDGEKMAMWYSLPSRVLNYLSIIITVVLVATTFYIIFTPVASENILGCQPRYILPILFPFIYFISRNGLVVERKFKEKAMAWGSMIMVLVFFYNMYTLCIKLY